MSAVSLRTILSRLANAMSRPQAFLLVALYAVLWFALEPATFDMHAVATLAVWMMTLILQRAEHRDTLALHAKLDELLHASSRARDEVTRIDELEPEDIERQRAAERA